MTSDNLRDRIAQIFYQVGNGVLVLNMSPNERNDLAQAIIDELGLTNEWSFRFKGKDRRYSLNRAEYIRTIGLYGPLEDAAIESRVVGKWVEQ